MTITQRTVSANSVEFTVLEAGSGPLALCLHGFPDTAHTWRHLLPTLAGAGFHAVAPFMRGYAPTAVPGDGRYQSGALVADAVALHEALGGDDTAVLVGHDWGAMAAYGSAAYSPDRWRRLVTLAVPPPIGLASVFTDYAQLRRSFYIFLFQTPFAEGAVPADDFAFIEALWRDWSPSYDGKEDVEHVKESLRGPANTAAAIGYYRAMLDPSNHGPEYAAFQDAALQIPPQPTLYLHGDEDGALGVELIADAEQYLSPGSRMEIIAGTGHFLHLEKPDVIDPMIVSWLQQ